MLSSPIAKSITPHGGYLSFQDTRQTRLSVHLAHAVHGAVVQLGVGWLGLQADTNVLHWSCDDSVGQSCNGSGSVEFAEREGLVALASKLALGPFERSKLDGDTGSDTQKRGQSSLPSVTAGAAHHIRNSPCRNPVGHRL